MSETPKPKTVNYFLPLPLPVPDLSNGSCRGLPTEWWFPDANPTTEARRQSAHAVEICEQCPEQKKCLDFAVEHASVIGIWGGTFPRQRQNMRRKLGVKR